MSGNKQTWQRLWGTGVAIGDSPQAAGGKLAKVSNTIRKNLTVMRETQVCFWGTLRNCQLTFVLSLRFMLIAGTPPKTRGAQRHPACWFPAISVSSRVKVSSLPCASQFVKSDFPLQVTWFFYSAPYIDKLPLMSVNELKWSFHTGIFHEYILVRVYNKI